jgi:hypothetical protein
MWYKLGVESPARFPIVFGAPFLRSHFITSSYFVSRNITEQLPLL